jgi:hypothetical protein
MYVALAVKFDADNDLLPTESLSLPSVAPRASAQLAAELGVRPHLRDRERYQILGEHGRGGLGRVSRARDRELGRDVAIKERLSRDPLEEVRFLREALITARLEHPGIVPVHEAGRWPDGTPFYAMKLVSGRSLRSLITGCTTSDQRLGLFDSHGGDIPWLQRCRELTAAGSVLGTSSDGRLLASYALDGSLDVFDLVNRQLVSHVTLAGHRRGLSDGVSVETAPREPGA